MSKIKGGCHCGSIAWEFDLPIKTVVKCHCSMCRRLQGADHSTYAVVPKEQFSLSKGKDLVVSYQATEKSYKNFCSVCGTPTHLVNGKHFPDDYVLPLGIVENYTNELAPKIQVYTSEKPPWSNIHDDVPLFS
ncbi:aldehyde-activating protein [Microbulbifer sp. A4B17]|uniref:GFA family protein n=1 Tax=Microbulbifer sp. A4B17 TaxID=359370 RepID=UPI000D52C057|nr:GFA family protein [Microbulbifer sp. A4B17]AWF82153.1 aldehyde-activating protein [Microbulbifer sp. A4B17]